MEFLNRLTRAADRGPIYVLLVAGALVLAYADSTELVVSRAHALTAPEFITCNVVGAGLIIAAGVIGLLISRTALHGLEAVSRVSSDSVKVFAELTKTVSSEDAILQGRIASGILEITRSLGVAPKADNAQKPAAAPASTTGMRCMSSRSCSCLVVLSSGR